MPNENDVDYGVMAKWKGGVVKTTLGQKIFGPSKKIRGRHHRIRRMRTNLRIASNIGLILGQIVLLFMSRDIGLGIIILSSLLSVPFFLKEQMLDVLVLIFFMQVINITGLIMQ